MGVYDRQRATALRLIAEKGETCVWRKLAATGGTAAKPGSTTPSDNTVKIVFLPIELEYLGTALSMLKDTEVPHGYVLGLMGAVSFEPALDDVIIRANGTGETVGLADKNGIEVIDPNGEGAVLYILRIAR